jgi:HPt (histidine-containing phosphotransfer) domain-containing protein
VAVHAVSQHTFDVVLMDMMMPVMDGLEATVLIRAMAGSKGGVPIVAMTANAMESDRERCLAAGMNDYISKPIKAQELQALLQNLAPVASSMQAEGLPGAVGGAPAAPGLQDFAFDYRAGLADMDQEILEIIGQAFLDQWPHDLHKLRSCLQTGDAMPVFHTAHALKATLAMFGADPASQLAARMEQLAQTGDLDPVATLLPAFTNEVDLLRNALERCLAL